MKVTEFITDSLLTLLNALCSGVYHSFLNSKVNGWGGRWL
jgi:hypothetical protein